MFERQEWKFYFLFTDSVCSECIMDWAKQNMVLISGLTNICEIYLSTEIQHGGRGELTFPLYGSLKICHITLYGCIPQAYKSYTWHVQDTLF